MDDELVETQGAISTRTTKVMCYGCHKFVLNEKSTYGTTPYEPLHPPEHYCKDCTDLLEVVSYDPLKKRE